MYGHTMWDPGMWEQQRMEPTRSSDVRGRSTSTWVCSGLFRFSAGMVDPSVGDALSSHSAFPANTTIWGLLILETLGDSFSEGI